MKEAYAKELASKDNELKRTNAKLADVQKRLQVSLGELNSAKGGGKRGINLTCSGFVVLRLNTNSNRTRG